MDNEKVNKLTISNIKLVIAIMGFHVALITNDQFPPKANMSV